MPSFREIRYRILRLMRNPVFLGVTLFGNGCIMFGGYLFHLFESGANPAASSRLDCLVWAVGIVTTVGLGDMPVVTVGGKILSIVMMLGGALFLWTYMALIVGALIEPEMHKLQSDVTRIRQGVRRESELDERMLLKLQTQLAEMQEALANSFAARK